MLGVALIFGVHSAESSSKVDPHTAKKASPISHRDSTVKNKDVEVTFPVFEHPRPAVNAALSAAIASTLGSYLGDPGTGQGSASCDVSAATTEVVSLRCQSMVMDGSLTDPAAGGGAPAEPTVWTLLLLIDGESVRQGSLADLVGDPKRGRAALFKKLQAAVTTCHAGMKLLPGATFDAFTLSDAGATFHLSMSLFDFHADLDVECEDVTLSRDDLRGLLRRGGALDRVDALSK